MSVAALPEAQQQYLYLVRLAWSLHMLGVGSCVELSAEAEPTVVLPLASGRLKISAVRRRRGWVYAWGRSRAHSAPAEAETTARQIAGLVSR